MKINNKYLSYTGFTLMLLSFVGFVLGLVYPILSTKQSILGITLKYQEVRVVDSIKLFFESGGFLISFLILMFVVVTPSIKYVDLFIKFTFPDKTKKVSKHLSAIDKWSMIDVFLVALLVLNFKMNSNIIVMKLKLGTTFIALSVILRILATQLLNNYKYYCLKNNIMKI